MLKVNVLASGAIVYGMFRFFLKFKSFSIFECQMLFLIYLSFQDFFAPIHWNHLMIAGNLSVNVLNGMPCLLKKDGIVLKHTT